MEDTARISIVVAAANMAGPVGNDQFAWNAKVLENATLLMEMAGEGSKLSKLINGMANAKTFFGTVLSVRREESSTRGVVSLKTRPSKFHPDGIEDARTDRTGSKDAPEGGRELAKLLTTLVGHRVQLWVELEVPANAEPGSKGFRVIRHVKDLGVDKDAESAEAA